jgi:hypothetical protein
MSSAQFSTLKLHKVEVLMINETAEQAVQPVLYAVEAEKE